MVMQKLNFITCLKTDILPETPEPFTVYIIKDDINNTYEIKISDESSNYLNSENSNININTVTNYRSSYEQQDNYIYSGFLLNTNIVIKRFKDNIEEIAQNTNNLEQDWINRLNLTYT